MSQVMRLSEGAERVGRSIRTLYRWQSMGILRILPGGWVVESEVVQAEAEIRRRFLLEKYGRT